MVLVPDVVNFLLFLGVIAIIFFLGYRKSRNGNDKVHSLSIIVLIFINVALAIHFTSKSFLNIVFLHSYDDSFFERYRTLFSLLTINISIQYLLIYWIKSGLSRFVVPMIINFILCFFMMYWTGYGIINIVWSIIYSGCLCGYLLCVYIMDDIQKLILEMNAVSGYERKKDFIELARKESDKFLKLGAQALFALGGSLGVSMSILFKDGWANIDKQEEAAVMTISFLLVAIGVLFSLGKPYLEITSELSGLQHEMVKNNTSNETGLQGRARRHH
jgi:hypothetical protein